MDEIIIQYDMSNYRRLPDLEIKNLHIPFESEQT
jgi:hypothetical protein